MIAKCFHRAKKKIVLNFRVCAQSLDSKNRNTRGGGKVLVAITIKGNQSEEPELQLELHWLLQWSLAHAVYWLSCNSVTFE